MCRCYQICVQVIIDLSFTTNAVTPTVVKPCPISQTLLLVGGHPGRLLLYNGYVAYNARGIWLGNKGGGGGLTWEGETIPNGLPVYNLQVLLWTDSHSGKADTDEDFPAVL